MSDIIELAPRNPYGLAIASPLLPAPGCAVRDIDLGPYGAVVTRTVTAHTRHAPPTQFAAVPGGLVVSSLPTISLRRLLREDAPRWERTPLPVIVSVQGEAAELDELVTRLENYDIAGLVVIPEGDAVAAVRAAREATPRPILALLRADDPIVATAQALEAAGADALIVAGPPRAAAPTDGGWDGYLLGPAVFPLVLQTLRDLQGAVELPRVLMGGCATPDAARAALDAGATALMIDAARWGDLAAGQRIAAALDATVTPMRTGSERASG